MALSPSIVFSEFFVNRDSPSGSRHLTSHIAYSGVLGTGAGEYLNFGTINLTNGKQNTDTKVLLAYVSDMKDATEAVFNLRFWVADFSDFTSGTYYFNGWASGAWIKGAALTDSSGYYAQTALPSGQNLWRQDDTNEITAANDDDQVTQYMYLGITTDIDVPNKTYGGDAGGLAYRLTFDYR